MQLVFESKSKFETQKIAYFLAKEIIKLPVRSAFVLALEGNLGSGKTTFTQGFASALGIKENVLSPTFVLMKVYSISQKIKDLIRPSRRALGKRLKFNHLIHIDCYRFNSKKDLSHLGFKDLLKDKDAIILIEWADRVKKLLPRDTIWIRFQHGKKPYERIIKILNPKS